jgi:hypothetical protein
MSLANTLDIDLASSVTQKLAANAGRYPADLYRGRFRLSD